MAVTMRSVPVLRFRRMPRALEGRINALRGSEIVALVLERQQLIAQRVIARDASKLAVHKRLQDRQRLSRQVIGDVADIGSRPGRRLAVDG